MIGSRPTNNRARLAAVGCLSLLLAACAGASTAPTGVSATSATLSATVSCDGNSSSNPCLAWFQWWADASNPTIQSSRNTPIGPVSSAASNVAVTQSVSGLTPGALYHYELCGQGDQNITSPICVGPNWNHGNNPPGSAPTAIDATSNFRTANPGANPATNATVDFGRVASSGETNGVIYERDGGQGVQFSTNPSRSLWIFGDTLVTRSGSTVAFLAGSVGAIATGTPGQPAASLTEVQSPLSSQSSNGAFQFLGPPQALPNCTVANLNAKFPSDGITSASPNRYNTGAVAREPASSRIVMLYEDVCLGFNAKGLDKWIIEAEGIAEYDPISNVFPLRPTPLSAPGGTFNQTTDALPTGLASSRLAFVGAVFFTDGSLYLYSADGGFGTSSPANEYVARIDTAHWTNGAAYRWCVLSGGTCAWTSDFASATPVTTVNPFGVAETSFADFSSQASVCASNATTCYVILSQAFGIFQVLASPTPWGPFRAGPAGQVPDSCVPGALGCYSVDLRPELSTSSQLVYSWFSSDDTTVDYGHPRLGVMPWSTPV